MTHGMHTNPMRVERNVHSGDDDVVPVQTLFQVDVDGNGDGDCVDGDGDGVNGNCVDAYVTGGIDTTECRPRPTVKSLLCGLFVVMALIEVIAV